MWITFRLIVIYQGQLEMEVGVDGMRDFPPRNFIIKLHKNSRFSIIFLDAIFTFPFRCNEGGKKSTFPCMTFDASSTR